MDTFTLKNVTEKKIWGNHIGSSGRKKELWVNLEKNTSPRSAYIKTVYILSKGQVKS